MANNRKQWDEQAEREWWAAAGLPAPDARVTFDRRRWTFVTARRWLRRRGPMLWAARAAGLAVALVGGMALWHALEPVRQVPAAVALYAKQLPQHPLAFEVVVTNRRVTEAREVSLIGGGTTGAVRQPLSGADTYSVFGNLTTPSVHDPSVGWDVGGLRFTVTAREPHAASADLVAVVPTGGSLTVQDIATNRLLEPSGHHGNVLIWPITMGTAIRITEDQPEHSAKAFLLKIAWTPLPAKIGSPAVVGVLPLWSGSWPKADTRTVSLPPNGSIVAALPQGLLVQTPWALGLDSWTGVFTPLLREPGGSTGWSVVAVGSGPWVLVSHYSTSMPQWPGSHATWWNMATGQLRAANLGQPDRILASGDEFAVSGGTHPGVYRNGRKVASFPAALLADAASGMLVAGSLNAHLGTYDVLTHHFQPAGLQAIEGHPVSPSLPGVLVWFPQWGPTLVLQPGGHQPWPNAHAHLAALSGEFPPIVADAGMLNGNTFLIRQVGNTLEAGWPDAGGQWTWNRVATVAGSANLQTIPNGVSWRDATGTHVWFRASSSD